MASRMPTSRPPNHEQGTSFIQTLIDHEIRHYVALEAKNGGLLRASTVVEAIMRTYPNIFVGARELEDMVIEAAARAHVAIEMGAAKPRRSSRPSRR
jgi:hypothetical protein